jgi:glutaconyl-CoA/methylmalonyl-CoA decarboxylase subunit gamma
MRYFVALGAREIPVDVTALPSGGWDVRVDGQAVQVDTASAGDALSVRVDGRVLDVLLDGPLPNVKFIAGDLRGDATIETERSRAGRSTGRGGAGKGPEVVTAPMPGRIVRIPVAVGDAVETGAPLIVIEAMKMENELRALHAARVAAVHVKPGDTVERGAKLVSFE